MKLKSDIVVLSILAIGVVLRMIGFGIPDMATDEAQASFGVSAAWTPLGMTILHIAQELFGAEIVVVRSVSLLFGIGSLVLIYLLSRELTNEKTSLLITAVAAIFPSHILFSKLAYLSIQQSFWWLLTLYAFLKAHKQSEMRWLALLFFASVGATMTKTQGLLLPFFLTVGVLVEEWKNKKNVRSLFHSPLLLILVFSLVPISFYLLTSPGIAATLFLYGGNMYGVSGFIGRFASLGGVWLHLLGLFMVAILLSIRSIRNLPWSLLVLLCISMLIGFLLGPSHEYYATHLVLLAAPIGIALSKLAPTMRYGCLIILTCFSVAMFGPVQTPLTYRLYRERGFWNTYAAEINDILKEEEAVTVLGFPGHHIRWYMEPSVLVGKSMEQPYPTDYVLVLGTEHAANVNGRVVDVYEHVGIIFQDGKDFHPIDQSLLEL